MRWLLLAAGVVVAPLFSFRSYTAELAYVRALPDGGAVFHVNEMPFSIYSTRITRIEMPDGGVCLP